MVFVLVLAMVGTIEDFLEKPGPVVGVVVDAAGRPAGGAEILATGGDWTNEGPQVFGRATADSEGRFTLTLAAGVFESDRPGLWAGRAGSLVARRAIDRDAGAASGVRLVLAAPGRGAVLVAGPDGKPIAGARVVPVRLAREGSSLPEPMARLASAVTDGGGRAVVEGFQPEELVEVRVEAPGFGAQVRDFRGPDGLAGVGTKAVHLRAVGRVEGRVTAADGTGAGPVAGLTVRVASMADGMTVGLATARTDDAGRFAVEAIASGTVAARVETRAGSPDLPARVARRRLDPGQVARVEIPLRRGVRVFGRVRDRGDGRPVAGARVAVVSSGPVGPIAVASDASGRFEAFVPAGQATHRVLRVPEPYLAPPEFLGPRPVVVPAAIAGFELPPIELTRGAEVRGLVVDAAGRPAPGARVEATWTMIDGRSRVPRKAVATAAPDGSFVVGAVAPEAELALTASAGDASTVAPTPARASDRRAARLTVVEVDAVAPSGRVVDADGRPMAGATVRIDALDRSPAGSIAGGERLDLDGLATDADGRFQGPRKLRRGREYRAAAVADGHASARSRPWPTPIGAVLAFPDLVLARDAGPVALSGRVLDRRGRPVAGAAVWASAQGPAAIPATTPADGTFRLEGLAAGRSFLFASRHGYRFAGRVVDPSRGAVAGADVTLTALDEAPEPPGPARPVAAAAAGAGLARAVLAPYADRVLGGGDHATRARTLELLARVEPGRVLAWIATGNREDAWLADHLRRLAARRLAGSSPEEVAAVVEAIRDDHQRALAALDAADALPKADRAAKLGWIDRALRDARAIADPADRVATVAGVADRLIDLGQVDRAAWLLEEIRPDAEGLGRVGLDGRARGEFACCLARVDPDRALALIRDLVDPSVTDACRLEIALAVAHRDPAAAARLVATLRDPDALARGLPALCHALAPVDRAAARALLAEGRGDAPCLPPYALGMMALAVAPTDPPAATAWLREAFDRLEAVADAGPPPAHELDPAAVAAALLPVAERVDPAMVPELTWRAVSFRARKLAAAPRSDAVLALLLARYDRAAALALFEPLAAHPAAILDGDLAPVLAAAALLDPALAVRLLEGLPDAPDLAFHHPKNAARLALAAALAREAPACWDHATVDLLHLWTADNPRPGE